MAIEVGYIKMFKQPLTILLLFVASFQCVASLTLAESGHGCFVAPDGIANVSSPMRGVVSQMPVNRGDFKNPASGILVELVFVPCEYVYDEPAMSIAILGLIRVEVGVPAEMFGFINIQDRALITAELDPDHPLMAGVDTIDALLDTRSSTFGLRLGLPNNNCVVAAAQRCTVDFDMISLALEIAEEPN